MPQSADKSSFPWEAPSKQSIYPFAPFLLVLIRESPLHSSLKSGACLLSIGMFAAPFRSASAVLRQHTDPLSTGQKSVLISGIIIINLFILETAEPALNHDLVGPAAFAIYALPDLLVLNE